MVINMEMFVCLPYVTFHTTATTENLSLVPILGTIYFLDMRTIVTISTQHRAVWVSAFQTCDNGAGRKGTPDSP